MIPLLFALLIQQGQVPLTVEMQVDADHIPMGGEVVLTVRARSGSPDPIQIVVPPFAGMELLEKSERSEVAAAGDLARTTVLEFRLRGSTAGKWRLGPARVRQGRDYAEAPPLEVEVTGTASASSPSSPALSPRVQRLLAQSRPPRSGHDASVSTLLSTTSPYVGEQVDVVTAAWFPRELRLQLRRPPTVQTPSIDGVYSYPQRAPAGIAASRQVDGHWFDLFVVHQIVFPLTPGKLTVPAATLHYSVPLAFQFFSQEERYAVKSDPRQVEVRALPANRPADFTGAVGGAITLDRALNPRSGRAGEPFTMDVLLRGEGNIALWPAPDITWPRHLRAYTERVSDRIEITDGKLGGTKTFRYLVIPDSARTAGLPALDYQYFDPATGNFTQTHSAAMTYLVAPGKAASVSRVSPAPLQLRNRPAPARWLLEEMPPWSLLLLAIGPPLLALLRFIPIRRKQRALAGPVRDPTAHVEAELTAALGELVPRLHELEGTRLENALRAVGVEADIARQAVQLREHLRRFRYGPSRESGRNEVLAEAAQLLPRLKGPGKAERVRRTISVATPAVLLLLVAARAGAQTLTPEQLYDRGALAQAASGFASRAQLDPDVAAHWFNLGAAEFRMGQAGPAMVAWTRARRLAPRDPAIRRALALVPAPDSRSVRDLWSPPVTPEELWIAAAVLWLVGWLGFALSRGRHRWAVVVMAGLVLAAAAGGLSRWYRRPLAIVTADYSIALSPHELAPAVLPVQVGSVVSLITRAGNWAMVRASNGQVGWLPREVVEPL
ncbi:MAG TPA: BatD family protein [Gemmatimonadales bacterium]|nr:BatD family protein [Gemmatimonadales bacterium]